jgi:uncharacterized protein YaaN involved in tellurite resistance
MSFLWYPGQDVDFLERLQKVEKEVRKILSSERLSGKHLTADDLETENEELRTRIDDLEEMVITLSQELSDLEEKIARGYRERPIKDSSGIGVVD